MEQGVIRVEARGVSKSPTTRASEGRRMLDVAVRRTQTMPALREVASRHATARAFLERLAFYLTPDLPHPAGVPLLDLALRTALAYYRDRTENGVNDARTLLLELVAGAFTPLPSVVEISVKTRYDAWDPLQGEPLAMWLAAHPQAKMEAGELVPSVASLAPRAIRSALAFHLLQPADLAALPEGALSTIVDYPDR